MRHAGFKGRPIGGDTFLFVLHWVSVGSIPALFTKKANSGWGKWNFFFFIQISFCIMISDDSLWRWGRIKGEFFGRINVVRLHTLHKGPAELEQSFGFEFKHNCLSHVTLRRRGGIKGRSVGDRCIFIFLFFAHNFLTAPEVRFLYSPLSFT